MENKGKRTTIRARMLRLVLISAGVLIILLTEASSIITYNDVINTASDDGHSLASSYGSAVQTLVDTLKTEIEGLATNTDILDENKSLGERKELLQKYANSTNFKDFSVSDENGKTYNDTDISKREYFQEAMRGTTYISSPVERLTDNSCVLMVGTPIKVEGKSGAIYGAIDASKVSELLKGVSFGDDAFVTIFDKHGQVVASTDYKLVTSYSDYSKEEVFTKIEKDEDGYKVADYKLVAQEIADTDGWTIVVGTKFSYYVFKVLNSMIIMMMLGVTLFIIAAIVGFKVSARISLPIAQTTDRLSKLSEGDIKTEVDIAGRNDETGVLSDAVNTTITELAKYINDIDNMLAEMSKGNLTVRSEIEYKGDFINIKNSLNTIAENLHNTLGAINNSVDSLHMGARQIAEGSQSLSENAITQASAADEVQSTLSGIAMKATDTATKADEIHELTETATREAKNGGESLEKLVEAITDIQEKSNAISGIIKTIEDISFQTNILSLNASIEAARAGEAGKGFSVVASEVGNLVGKSAEASNQTSNLIKESAEAVEKGVILVEEVKAEVQKIIKTIELVADKMEVIARAANDEQTAVEQVNKGMEQINNGMHTTTATAEESAASSEELYGLANQLSDELKKFKM